MKKDLEIRNQKPKSGSYKPYVLRPRSMIGALLVASALFLLSFGRVSGDITVGDVDNTRTALEKLVETRRIISQEKRDFELGKEMLSARIELVGREIESLRGKISETENGLTEADKKRAELIAENEKFKDVSNSLFGTVTKLETGTKELLKRLPYPIRERIRPLSHQFPENPDETEMSLGIRFQNVVGVLNEVNKFNREITVTSEVRELPDKTSAEVTVLYIGIGQAYYVNGNGDVAGIGTTSPEGWIWIPANEAAAGISKAIAILKNETAAAFVRLPIEIK